jgi:peptide/nickel transport system substrate-binding protein
MKFAEAHKGTFGNPGVLLMGTGPYEVVSFDPTSGVDLAPNPSWWGGSAPFQHIAFTFFSNETTLALAFRAGEIDFVPEIISPQGFASTSGAKLISTPSCDNTVFSMNTRSPGWDDVHVRRAVAYALDRTALQVANGGYSRPIYTLTPPQMLLSIASQSQVDALLKSLPLYPYSIAKAKAEMAQSAYPHGFSATLLAPIYGTEVNVDQVIAAELQKIGINLQVKAVTVPAWLAVETGPGGKRLASLGEGGCFNPDPSAYNDLLGSWNTKPGGVNLADYAPPALDNLINAGLAASAPVTRFGIYSKIFRTLQTDEPYVGLFVRDFSIALSSKFTYPVFSSWSFNSALGVKPVE